jgi:hypothetical protein
MFPEATLAYSFFSVSFLFFSPYRLLKIPFEGPLSEKGKS